MYVLFLNSNNFCRGIGTTRAGGSILGVFLGLVTSTFGACGDRMPKT
jgi:hypothetical protein